MNIKYLKTFITLAGNLNFTKSAEVLFISQPAISRQISNLENEIGHPLFERNKRSVSLTPYGEEMVVHAERLLMDYDHMLTHMEEIDALTSVSLKIGLMNDLNNDAISRNIRKYMKEHPEINIDMIFMSPSRLFERLVDRTLDVAFTMIHPTMVMHEMAYTIIGQQALKLAVCVDHPLACVTEPVNLKAFDGQTLICMNKESNEMAYEHIKLIVKSSGFVPGKLEYSGTVTHLLAKVNCGLGITMVTETPDLNIPKNLVLLSIDHPETVSRVAVIWDDNNPKLKDLSFVETFMP